MMSRRRYKNSLFVLVMVMGVLAFSAVDAGILPEDGDARYELAFWESIKDSEQAADYEAYLEAFPNGRFAPLARARAAYLRKNEPTPKAIKPAFKVEEIEDEYKVLRTANVRESPSANSQRVGAVDKGNRILVTGRVVDSNWYRVKTGTGQTGYIYGALIRKSVENAVEPKDRPTKEQQLAKIKPTPPPIETPSLTEGQSQTSGFRDCAECPEMRGDKREQPVHRVTPVGEITKNEEESRRMGLSEREAPESEVEPDRPEPEAIDYTLTVEAQPADARVRILNIKPRYYSGIRLWPGHYHIEVSKSGYEMHREWIKVVDADQVVKVTLQRHSVSSDEVADRREWVDPVTGMAFVRVPKECFQMGSNGGAWNEKPVHEICVDGFWMGKYEVTQGQWKKVMESNPSKFKKNDNHPVEQVSWNDVQKFISNLNARGQGGFRLSTEAEWEYACRSGGKKEKYCGGDDVERVAWYRNNSGQQTHPVGKKSPNALGLHDMSGNVWEWVGDRYADDYYRKSPRYNPKGPSTGSGRVIRGGGWDGDARYCRSAYRSLTDPGLRFSYLGFRLARTSP